jgi:hypothetical protein
MVSLGSYAQGIGLMMQNYGRERGMRKGPVKRFNYNYSW